MSILFTSVLSHVVDAAAHLKGVYSVIVGSNIGALLSPLGALAGVMWSNILNKQGVEFSFLKFCRYGVVVSIPTILFTLLTLQLTLGC